MIIKIKPFDTLFFRDGKPFSMGDEVWAAGMFPPSPSVIYGALRTAYFAQHPEEILKANNEGDPTQNLRIKFIAVAIEKSAYMPVGQDLVAQKSDGDDFEEQFYLFPESRKITSSSKFSQEGNTNTTVLTAPTSNPVENASLGSMISFKSFKKYLKQEGVGGEKIFEVWEAKNYLSKDPKTGIGRTPMSGSVVDGKLYRVEMLRMAVEKRTDISIMVECEGLDIPSTGMIKLGGEGKGAMYHEVDKENARLKLPDVNLSSNYFRLFLATPALFEKGWLPSWIDEESLEGEFNGIKLRLVSAAIDKPIYIGGFNMKKKKGQKSFKPMRRAVRAGGVYFFELMNELDKKKIMDAFHGKCISDERAKEGFGLAYVGDLKASNL